MFLPGGLVVEGPCWSVLDQTRSWDPGSAAAARQAGAACLARQRNLRTSSLRVFTLPNRSNSSSCILLLPAGSAAFTYGCNDESRSDHGVAVGENVAVLRIERPIRPEIGRPIQDHADADRRSFFNSAIRIDDCTDARIGRPDHVPAILDGPHNSHSQMLKRR